MASPAEAAAAACADPQRATNSSTAVSILFGTTNKPLKLEVRRGKINGKWYGWARWSGHTRKGDTPALFVSFDGGKTGEVKCSRGVSESNGGPAWSGAYPESASSKVKFRAIVTFSNGNDWRVGKTGWW
ncbi:hypothetical protein [Nonomuraea basaltis]|uniref:hypothetical protein n=1 Tax=Nonomuraea basaltis TaxID=2495887 RepID=UPI00110C4AB3|nr:hypothetical protein [Nonomuraea basaltis]TMR88568.1 hypothetical protein EJK15_65465 [Nonomuraea basaltis]